MDSISENLKVLQPEIRRWTLTDLESVLTPVGQGCNYTCQESSNHSSCNDNAEGAEMNFTIHDSDLLCLIWFDNLLFLLLIDKLGICSIYEDCYNYHECDC